MNKKSKSAAAVLFGALVLAMVFGEVQTVNAAEISTAVVAEGPEGESLINRLVSVSDSCTVTDVEGGTHTLTGYVAACALQSAKDAGYINDFTIKSFSFGLWLDSINDLATTPDFSQGWTLWENGSLANVGIQGLVLAEGDEFKLTYGPWPTEEAEQRGGPVVTDVLPKQVDVEQAIAFLTTKQAADGSIGSFPLSDWAALAFGAYEGRSASAFVAKEDLKEWLAQNPVPEGALLTDYERRAMALMALGINPYQGTSQNVIEPILSGFDGQQFGSEDLVNDDVFAALVLLQAGQEANVTPLLETFDFLVSWQRESGSFGNPDITAAAVQALALFPESEARDEALASAKEYLEEQQEQDGGFGNVYATAWVLQAIAALNEDGGSWAIDKRTPEHYLAVRQALDGGLPKEDSPENRIWATAYAIPAALEKSWGDVLHNFEKSAAPQRGQLEGQEQEEELTLEEQAALQAQIEALEQEISLASGKLQKLQHIEREVSRIAREVEKLRPQVLALHNQYLASLEQEDQKQESGLARVLEPQRQDELPALDEETAEQKGAALSVETQEENGGQFAAAAAGGVNGQNFFATAFGQIVLVVTTGVVVFLLLGGTRVIGQYVPRLTSSFRKSSGKAAENSGIS